MPKNFAVFNPLRAWKEGDLPSDPTVTIVLNEISRNQEERIAISQELADDKEIDSAIDDLQKELETVRKEAKRVLNTQKKKLGSPWAK